MSNTSGRASLDVLLSEIRGCTVCAQHLPLGPRPVIQAGREARILIIGHAPGTRVHESGIPWTDQSGARLRKWLGVDEASLLDESKFAIVSMGFCYPGRGTGGDKPPRPECAPLWHERALAELPNIELTLLIGQHSQRRYLGSTRKSTLAETVSAWRDYAPRYIPLPHPSPRNLGWFKQHPWFETQVLPMLQHRVQQLIE